NAVSASERPGHRSRVPNSFRSLSCDFCRVRARWVDAAVYRTLLTWAFPPVTAPSGVTGGLQSGLLGYLLSMRPSGETEPFTAATIDEWYKKATVACAPFLYP